MGDDCFWDISSRCKELSNDTGCKDIHYSDCEDFEGCRISTDNSGDLYCFEECSELSSISTCSNSGCYWNPSLKSCSDKKLNCSSVFVSVCDRFSFYFFFFIFFFF
jgi:hypothetical protein